MAAKRSKPYDQVDLPGSTIPESIPSSHYQLYLRVITYLRETLTYSEADQTLVEQYVLTAEMIDQIRANLREEGLSVMAAHGVKTNPQLTALNASITSLTKLAATLGIGAAVRRRLMTEAQANKTKASMGNKAEENRWLQR